MKFSRTRIPQVKRKKILKMLDKEIRSEGSAIIFSLGLDIDF
jgi:hypothetical protein